LRPSAATPCDMAATPRSAQFKVPAEPRLRRLLAAGLRGWATGGGAVVLVSLLLIDSHFGDRGHNLPDVDGQPYGCVPASCLRSSLPQPIPSKERSTMTTTTNGQVRKTLASQLDRLDTILDGLSDALNDCST